ncbi:hypothetical protein G7046_g8146 [Stylonectria norvegica]|nr:hypothetical protein G7046_g8146 [Stylonectria norvegica]
MGDEDRSGPTTQDTALEATPFLSLLGDVVFAFYSSWAPEHSSKPASRRRKNTYGTSEEKKVVGCSRQEDGLAWMESQASGLGGGKEKRELMATRRSDAIDAKEQRPSRRFAPSHAVVQLQLADSSARPYTARHDIARLGNYQLSLSLPVLFLGERASHCRVQR